MDIKNIFKTYTDPKEDLETSHPEELSSGLLHLETTLAICPNSLFPINWLGLGLSITCLVEPASAHLTR